MANERLRATLLQKGVTPDRLADLVEVDAKTVERWVGGRVPYRRHRYAVATALQVDEAYLWPDALDTSQLADAAESEILTVYPHRWVVPRDVFVQLFSAAEAEIGVLVFSGTFLVDDPGLMALFASKAKAGVRIRLLLGDPESPELLARSQQEGVEDGLVSRVRNALTQYTRLVALDGVELRVHSTPLYNSIYRGDDDLLVNTHVYGASATVAPVLHLRRVAGGDMVSMYLESFERVWSHATPWEKS